MLFTVIFAAGGVIYGSNAATGLKDTVTTGAALNGTGQYGIFSGGTFTPKGSLSTTNNTARVENGILLTE